MFKNYFKTAWRNITKSKANSFINIAGLSVGMAVAMFIGLWIWDELSFNKYHENYDRIAAVMQHETYGGAINTGDAIPLFDYFITLSFQTIKAAIANPVKSLRTE